MSFLALADADRVQDYVFGPPQLRHVRGGSALQLAAIKKIRDEFPREIIFANGGVALAELSTEARATEFCTRAKAVFHEVTRGAASISAAYVEEKSSFIEADARFLDAWDRVQDEVERAKRHRHDVSCGGSHWLWSPCERCGVQMAQIFTTEAGGVEVAKCESCDAKWKKGEKESREYDNFEDLADQSHPPNYLALIYLDLDGMGRYFRKYIKSKKSCGEVSEAVDNAVRESVTYAIEEISDSQSPLPASELLVGGDDAVVMLQSHLAIPFMDRFEALFMQPNRWSGNPVPTFSAGVIYAHSHFPISEFVSLAKRACSEAKEMIGAHSLSFQLITSALAGTASGPATANPYTTGEFQALASHVRAMKRGEVPRSKINQLHAVSQLSRREGELAYGNLLARCGRPLRQALERAVGTSLWFQRKDGSWATRGAAVAELWEFVRA